MIVSLEDEAQEVSQPALCLRFTPLRAIFLEKLWTYSLEFSPPSGFPPAQA